jgi:hypothetical protein
MALDFNKLAGLVKAYGSPLYGSAPVQELGSVTPAEYQLIDGNTLAIIDGDTTYYIPVRRSAIEAGITEDRVFNIGEFEATRDADGEYNGQSWSVAKGTRKVFAY